MKAILIFALLLATVFSSENFLGEVLKYTIYLFIFFNIF